MTGGGQGGLSHAQHALWLAQHLQPHSTAFNIFALVRCELPFEHLPVEGALAGLVRDHAALRVHLPITGAEPSRRVRAEVEIPFSVVEAATWDEERLRRESYAFAERPFDLERGPLFRARFFLRDPGFMLLLAGHHTVVDFSSLCLLSVELMKRIRALQTGSVLPVEPTDDRDYLLWERELLASDRAARSLAYWADRLSRFPPPIELPTDHRRSVDTQRARLGSAPLRLDLTDAQLAALREVADTQGGSLYSVLLATVGAWLFRLCQREELVIGTTFSQRRRASLRPLIGPLLNTLPLHLSVPPDQSWSAWHQRVHGRLKSAFRHGAVPFNWLLSNLSAPSATSPPPNLDAFTPFVFNFAAAGFGGAAGRPHYWAQCGAPTELMITAYDMEQGLNLNFNYDAELFEASTIVALGQSLVHLLAELPANLNTAVARLPLAPRDRERQQLRGPEVQLPSVTYHRLFERQVEQAPERIAVSQGQRALTYEELNHRANAIAAKLTPKDSAPTSVVGLLAPRGPELLAGLLGVLKSGAAFVPLDVHHPPARWQTLLAAAGAERLVVADEVAPALGDLANLRQIRISSSREPALAKNRSVTGSLTDLAYVMFTSGSTGAPKGVMVEQLGMLNHILAKLEVTELSADDVLLQSASPAFVISVWQMLAPLLTGARVHVVDDPLLADPPALFAEIAAAEVTVVQTVPALLALWLQQEPETLGRLRLMISTGETLTPELARRWLNRYPAVPLLNAYGPTECSDDVAHARLTRPPPLSAARVPVGEPIPNVQLTICDELLEPLPAGVPGEICVTGSAVARGYINLPASEAPAFRYEPERLYRTGDRGRRRADGRLEYLGRSDNQVKIRGHRLELGEIESLMAEHPGVQAAAARLWQDARGDPLLAAYVVPCQEGLAEAVAAHLAERLPVPLRPARILTLDRLPLNRNNKLDRQALPRPEEPRPAPIPPRNPREEKLAQIWQNLLGLPSPGAIGIRDNFFALGGHSLMLMEMHQRLEEAFGATLPVAELFETPTIAELAERLAAAQPTAPKIERRAADQRGSPVSSVQERFFVLEQLRPQSPQLNLAAAMRLRGPLEVEVLEAAFGDLYRRHEALRTRFGFAGGSPYQVVEAEQLAAVVSLFDTSDSGWEEVFSRAVEAAQRGFDVSRAPLLRIELYRLAEDDHLLVVAAHHLICDGWSVDLLVRDSLALYDARLEGREADLPEVDVQLGDYARWEVAQGDSDFGDDLAYWRQRLRDAAALELPAAFSTTDAQAQRMGVCQHRLAGEELADLRRFARAEETSLFRLLLTSLHVVMARLCGQLDVSIAVTAALRERPELQQTVGFLVNTVMIRADLSGDPTFRGILSQVHQRGIEAARHQTLPFERLLRVLQRERITEGGLSPLQTYLTFNQRAVDRYQQGDLTLELVDLPPPSPFVDLSFCADESPGGLDLRATFDADQFAIPQVDQLLDQWQRVLKTAARDPTRRLSEIELGSPAAHRSAGAGPRARSPSPWTDADLEGSLLDRFEQVATVNPAHAAVTTTAGTLTYAELLVAARDLAARLVRHGGVGARVAILFHNDALRLPVGVLGTLFAGQAFIPLDSTHPDQRLREVIESASPVALVYDSDLAERAADLMPADQLEPVASADEPADSALPAVAPSDLAYVMFTSGSTGRPKGVRQLHRNSLHFARAFGDRLGGVGPDDRVSLLANAAHDAGLMDFFVALLNGATLYPMDVRRRGLTESLAWFREAEITLVHTTPTFFRAWVGNLGDDAAPDSLRLITFDGEPSLRRDVELFARHFPADCWLLNCYGSTESSISMQALVREPAALPDRPAFSLEGPVDRTEVELRTPAGEQVALFGVGEIIVTSRFVTPGYWRNSELDAEVFTALPDGRRRYRTGDLGRWLPGGRIEVVGRQDRQIKVLGQRVELREIEARVRELTGAADSCVIHRELRAGHLRLEAYYCSPKREITEEALFTSLQATLPPFMVPQRCKRLDRIPRTPNTKIDRPALLRLAATFDEPTAFDNFATPLEEWLAATWRDLLGLQQIGPEISFFELGGDSLQLLELHHRLRQESHRIDVVELFRFPTIRSLAERLERGDDHSGDELVQSAKSRAAKRRAARRRRRPKGES